MFAVLSKSDIQKLYSFINIEKSWFNFLSENDIQYLKTLSNKTAKYSDDRGTIHELVLIFFQKTSWAPQTNNQGSVVTHLRYKGCINDFNDIIKLFSKYCKGCLDQVDSKGNTPMHYAVKQDVIHCVSSLLKYGASSDIMNKNYQTPLHLAVQYNNIEISELLLQYKADTSSQDNDGKTPAHYACKNNNNKLVDMLENYGADFSIKDNDGKTPEEYLNAYIKQQETTEEIADLQL